MIKHTKAGKTVFNTFEKKVNEGLFTEEIFSKKIEEASKLAEEMPYVTLTMRNRGIIAPDEGTAPIIHVFRPNLQAQDVAHHLGKLDKMTVHSADERAQSTIEYRSEERRVGKECRARWAPDHEKKEKTIE